MSLYVHDRHLARAKVAQDLADCHAHGKDRDLRMACIYQNAAHHHGAMVRRELRRSGLRTTTPVINPRPRADRAA